MRNIVSLTRRELLAAVAGLTLASRVKGEAAVREQVIPAAPFRVGPFQKVYEPGPRNASGQPPAGWHLNDHTIIRGHDGLWHMFGIAWTDPGAHPWPTASFLEHATSPALTGPKARWVRQKSVMYQQGDRFETIMWAPHVIRHRRQYHMFVASGGPDQTQWGITHATSPDLNNWTRVGSEPLFRDGFHARDPMVMWQPKEKLWALYYTATEQPERGRHVVAYRTSPNLATWSQRQIAYADRLVGTAAGPTESPFVVRRGEMYYLFIGPRPYEEPPAGVSQHTLVGYVGTDVFASRDWRRWDDANLVGHIPAHAPELVQDVDGSWLISNCGVAQGGLYLAPFQWLV